MWYDWMVGGWGGRNGKDGSNCTAPIFGVGLAVQPLEGQERLCPVLTTRPRDPHRLRRARASSAAAAASRRARTLTEAERTVMSYCCDRARSITWGIEGGLPSIPHGVWLNTGTDGRALPRRGLLQRADRRAATSFTRPSAGGGGFGDPLERDPASGVRGRRRRLRLDRAGAQGLRRRRARGRRRPGRVRGRRRGDRGRARASIAAERVGWLEEDAESVAERYRDGELDVLDLVRHYGVILDWGTGELLPKTTEQFRAMLQRRSVSHWAAA